MYENELAKVGGVIAEKPDTLTQDPQFVEVSPVQSVLLVCADPPSPPLP